MKFSTFLSLAGRTDDQKLVVGVLRLRCGPKSPMVEAPHPKRNRHETDSWIKYTGGRKLTQKRAKRWIAARGAHKWGQERAAKPPSWLAKLAGFDALLGGNGDVNGRTRALASPRSHS
jgi:hypothetical protein